MTTAHDDLIHQVCRAYNLPFALIQAQMLHESSGDPFAFRYEEGFYRRYIKGNLNAKAARFGPLAACSYGLMQIVLETAYELGFDGRPEELFLDRVSLTWGCRKMRALWDNVGGQEATYRQALARYNGVGSMADLYADTVYRIAGST